MENKDSRFLGKLIIGFDYEDSNSSVNTFLNSSNNFLSNSKAKLPLKTDTTCNNIAPQLKNGVFSLASYNKDDCIKEEDSYIDYNYNNNLNNDNDQKYQTKKSEKDNKNEDKNEDKENNENNNSYNSITSDLFMEEFTKYEESLAKNYTNIDNSLYNIKNFDNFCFENIDLLQRSSNDKDAFQKKDVEEKSKLSFFEKNNNKKIIQVKDEKEEKDFTDIKEDNSTSIYDKNGNDCNHISGASTSLNTGASSKIRFYKNKIIDDSKIKSNKNNDLTKEGKKAYSEEVISKSNNENNIRIQSNININYINNNNNDKNAEDNEVKHSYSHNDMNKLHCGDKVSPLIKHSNKPNMSEINENEKEIIIRSSDNTSKESKNNNNNNDEEMISNNIAKKAYFNILNSNDESENCCNSNSNHGIFNINSTNNNYNNKNSDIRFSKLQKFFSNNNNNSNSNNSNGNSNIYSYDGGVNDNYDSGFLDSQIINSNSINQIFKKDNNNSYNNLNTGAGINSIHSMGSNDSNNNNTHAHRDKVDINNSKTSNLSKLSYNTIQKIFYQIKDKILFNYSSPETTEFSIQLFSVLSEEPRSIILNTLFKSIFDVKINNASQEKPIDSLNKLLPKLTIKEKKISIVYLKENMRTYIWNPFYIQLFETTIIHFPIKNLYFLIKYLIDESCAFLKLKCGYTILNELIKVLPVSKYYLELCTKLLTNVETFYRKHEIQTLIELVKKINYFSIDDCLDNIQTSLNNEFIDNQKYHFLCSKAIMSTMKPKFLKFCINKNLNRIAYALVEQKNLLFLNTFMAEFIYPINDLPDLCSEIGGYGNNIEITNNNSNNNSDLNSINNINNYMMYNKAIKKSFNITMLTNDSKFIKLLNNSKGLIIIIGVFEYFDTLSTKPIFDLLIKLLNINCNNEIRSQIIEVLLSLSLEKYGDQLSSCKMLDNSIKDKIFRVTDSNISNINTNVNKNMSNSNSMQGMNFTNNNYNNSSSSNNNYVNDSLNSNDNCFNLNSNNYDDFALRQYNTNKFNSNTRKNYINDSNYNNNCDYERREMEMTKHYNNSNNDDNSNNSNCNYNSGSNINQSNTNTIMNNINRNMNSLNNTIYNLNSMNNSKINKDLQMMISQFNKISLAYKNMSNINNENNQSNGYNSGNSKLDFNSFSKMMLQLNNNINDLNNTIKNSNNNSNNNIKSLNDMCFSNNNNDNYFSNNNKRNMNFPGNYAIDSKNGNDNYNYNNFNNNGNNNSNNRNNTIFPCYNRSSQNNKLSSNNNVQNCNNIDSNNMKYNYKHNININNNNNNDFNFNMNNNNNNNLNSKINANSNFNNNNFNNNNNNNYRYMPNRNILNNNKQQNYYN